MRPRGVVEKAFWRGDHSTTSTCNALFNPFNLQPSDMGISPLSLVDAPRAGLQLKHLTISIQDDPFQVGLPFLLR